MCVVDAHGCTLAVGRVDGGRGAYMVDGPASWRVWKWEGRVFVCACGVPRSMRLHLQVLNRTVGSVKFIGRPVRFATRVMLPTGAYGTAIGLFLAFK